MINIRKLQPVLLKTGGRALVVVLGGAISAVGLAAVWLKAPADDLGKLFLYLITSGAVSATLIILWIAYSQRLVSLRAQITVAYLSGAVITIVNILVTGRLMFLSAHDQNLLMLLLLFSGGIAIFFGLFLSEQLNRQVRQLTQGATEIARGKLETRVLPGGSYELAQLAQAFNQMAVQLETAFATQREMEQARKELVVAISHDLRTPLASLRLMTEAITDGVADEKQTALFLERMHGEVQYMTGLIEDLFELSQLDSGALKLTPERASLTDLISDTLESLKSQAGSKKQTLHGQIEGEIPEFSFDPRKIQRVLNNLLGNAIRYTPEKGIINLTARQQNGFVSVIISDNGEGISAADLEQIFEPFYRGERSRGRESGGAGLGLAIARGLVEAHGGHINAQSQEGKGSTFTFELPIK
ncbi:MAG TPA: HAMP domain-containing sensor histidine kinase [Chloroflexia bacterium]|nr:HAMP domain-containing sensor histidine kinase [Chloroflexia bacterium]